jgi:hypothetical protein
MEERFSKECLEEYLCSESVPKVFRKVPNCSFCLEALSKSSKEFREEFRKKGSLCAWRNSRPFSFP